MVGFVVVLLTELHVGIKEAAMAAGSIDLLAHSREIDWKKIGFLRVLSESDFRAKLYCRGGAHVGGVTNNILNRVGFLFLFLFFY